MTFKQLFTQTNFKVVHDADFCAVVSNDISKYLLYRYSREICCYALDFFQNVSIQDLMFLYDIKDDDKFDDEFVFENIIGEDKVLSYIFSLIENDDKSIKNLFKNDVFSIDQSDEFALVLKSTEKRPKTANILAFNKGGCRTIYANTNCIWKGGGEEHVKMVIAWNPYLLHTYLLQSKESFSSYILVKNCSNNSLKYPMLSDVTKEYNVICSSLDESVEAMRFVISLINIQKGTCMNLHYSSTMMEVEISLAPGEEVFQRVQLFSNVVKKVSQVYYESLSTNFDFMNWSKLSVQGKDYLYLNFVKVRPLINFLLNTFILEYKLKVNIINAL